MDWGFLSFLAEPWFVIPWYAIGAAGCAFVSWDLHAKNTSLKQAMKWAWPIIVFFFSLVGLALYFGTARAPGIGTLEPAQRQQAHDEYEKNVFRRVNGAVIHCVAGDGLGIMSGMVIARAVGMTFWQEFWFEYAVGFAFGLFIFQYKSMKMMTDRPGMALAMAFRAEFFSMLTVMAGMGAVMTYVTPFAVTEQPKPLTFAFWGFGMLGLLVGYVFTFPMNWMMVAIGWKHGMGGMEGAKEHEVERPGARWALVSSMIVLGAAALALPAWLHESRDGTLVLQGEEVDRARALAGAASGLETVAAGVETSAGHSLRQLEAGSDSDAANAIDAAMRAAEVAHRAAPGSAGLGRARQDVKDARRALHLGDEAGARRKLAAAEQAAAAPVEVSALPPADLRNYDGARVLNANGVEIGEITGVRGNRLELTLGGSRDVFGFLDLGSGERVVVPANRLVFGPAGWLGGSLVTLPTFATPGRKPAA